MGWECGESGRQARGAATLFDRVRAVFEARIASQHIGLAGRGRLEVPRSRRRAGVWCGPIQAACTSPAGGSWWSVYMPLALRASGNRGGWPDRHWSGYRCWSCIRACGGPGFRARATSPHLLDAAGLTQGRTRGTDRLNEPGRSSASVRQSRLIRHGTTHGGDAHGLRGPEPAQIEAGSPTSSSCKGPIASADLGLA
jgi:hypothetical protein